MLMVHHLGISQSERIVWLCKELGLDRDIAGYPSIFAYLNQIGERPAFRTAMARGDPNVAPLLR